MKTTLAIWLMLAASVAQAQNGAGDWTGNFAKNPGFEEDFVNQHAEGHVLSFKGDWFYNQKDLVPDFWNFTGQWTWETASPKSGEHILKLGAGTAEQSYPGMSYQEGGSAWGAAGGMPMKLADRAKAALPWRAQVWVRGGGEMALGPVSGKAPASNQWQQLTVELPADKVDPTAPVIVKLIGPGEFDDLVVQERAPQSPNLIANAGFEDADANGHPRGFSKQRKYRHLGPTYYVWTDWNHYFRENRGSVVVDRLVSNAGRQSLRFDVYPGDEKYIESDPITLNQTAPAPIEVAAYVRADRIKMFDIRCVDEDGADLKGYYPIQPENQAGGSATWGNGTFDWRYVRKFFTPAFDKPIKTLRVRLCARGFNAHTLDDSGTRSYACQSGTLWWDNIYVGERGTAAATLAGRAVSLQLGVGHEPGPWSAQIDLGERLYGTNLLSLRLTNGGGVAAFGLKLTLSLPDRSPAVTQSPIVAIPAGATAQLQVPYEIKQLVGDLKDQGQLRVELERDGQAVAASTYSFNTWPVVVDFDVARSYNLPEENPLPVSLNLGVAKDTLAKVKKLEIALASASDPAREIDRVQTITDLPAALAQTLAGLPKSAEQSFQFNLPTPGFWTDRTNLLMVNVDLGKLRVWPHDYPVRDTVVIARALDAAGEELFRDSSDPFCRMQAPPKLPAIQSVEVRKDGAILINGAPTFLTGATHQQFRITHKPAIVAQLGMSGMRLVNGEDAKFAALASVWSQYNIYVHQAKPISGIGSTDFVVEMTDAQKKELAAFVAAGGMQNVVSLNSGGWESHIPDDPQSRAKHEATNDWIYQTTKRPVSWSQSGAHHAWNTPTLPYYDINACETEMWGPMDLNVVWTPYMKRLFKRPSTWVYLPQLYDNHPFERYRFETYENIIRGSAGVLMIQGIGDPTFNRGLAGELRYLAAPLYSQEPAPAVTLDPPVSHKVTHYQGKTYILATNSGPRQIGNWTWNVGQKHSGRASHEGDTVNTMWFRPHGIRVHGFRSMPMPEEIRAGDKIVQYVWLDPSELPQWVMFAVRGDGKFIHNAVLGSFDYEKFRQELGNIIMFSELNQSVWHEINWVIDEPTFDMAVKLVGRKEADTLKQEYEKYRAKVDQLVHHAENFRSVGPLPPAGQWYRIEIDAQKFELVGKLVDGFAFLTQNGRALWDYTALERDGRVARVFCEDSVGIDRKLLDQVHISVPLLAAGTKVKTLFEDREIVAEQGGFTDDFQGTETYGYEAGGVEGDMFGYVKDPNRELPRMMPSGYGYKYGPTQVHIYEIAH